jgi:membrane protein implicated in regulation of membrane protease activity
MTKNGRRALFLLVATVANMLLTVIIIVAVWLGLSLLLSQIGVRNAGSYVIIVAFLAGVVLSFFIYGRVLKALRKRPDLEERFGLIK